MEKHETNSQEDLMEKMKSSLGLSESLPQEVLEKAKEAFVKEAEEGEENTEVLNNCLAEMLKLKDVKLKGTLVLIMMGHLPLEHQIALIEAQKEIVANAVISKSTQNGLGGLLLAAAIMKGLKNEQ